MAEVTWQHHGINSYQDRRTVGKGHAQACPAAEVGLGPALAVIADLLVVQVLLRLFCV